MIAFFIMPCVARAAPGDRFVWIDQDFAARPRSCGQVAWICAPYRLMRPPTRLATFRSGVRRYMPW